MSRAAALAFYDALNRRRFDDVAAMIAPDCPTGVPGTAPGPAAYLAMMETYLAGFPDLRHDVEEMLCAEDGVVVRLRTSGTHVGSFLGHEATDRRFTAAGIDILRFRNGLIAGRIAVFDTIAMLQQLGLYK